MYEKNLPKLSEMEFQFVKIPFLADNNLDKRFSCVVGGNECGDDNEERRIAFVKHVTLAILHIVTKS